jgi:hypothetical protein
MVSIPEDPRSEAGISVRLAPEDVEAAASIGVTRQVRSLARGRVPGYGIEQDKCWQAHIEGAIGELVAAKALDLPWVPKVDNFKSGGDVFGMEIRCRSRPEFELYIRPDEPGDRPYVLVRGAGLDYAVVGWYWGDKIKKHGRVEDFGRRNSPVYVVADGKLLSMTHEYLLRWIENHPE